MTLFNWFDTMARLRVEQTGDAVLEEHRLVRQAHQMIVDVAETVGDLLVDEGELAPRQPADDVALRLHDAAQRGDVLLEVRGSLFARLALLLSNTSFLELSSRSLELVDFRPIVVDHRVDDAVHQRRRSLRRAPWNCAGRSRAICSIDRESPRVNRHEVVAAEEEVHVVGPEAVLGRLRSRCGAGSRRDSRRRIRPSGTDGRSSRLPPPDRGSGRRR